MKIRITALIFSVAMLAVLLTGCGCEHEWAEATCRTPKTCNLCRETEGEALGHTWAEVTCAAPKTCTACGETEGEALPHRWVEANYQEPQTCSECGAIEGEPLPTLFDELGLKIWENFDTSSAIYSWADGKEFTHTEGHAKDLKGFIRAELQIGNNKEVLRVLVDTDVDVVIHENTHLEHAMDLYMEPFREAYDKELGKELTDEEWAVICETYKILDVEVIQNWDLEPHFKKLIQSNLRWKYSFNGTTQGIGIADKITGESLFATEKNKFYEDVGVLHINHEGKTMPVMAVFSFNPESGSLDNKLPWMQLSQNLIVFMPKEYTEIIITWGENTAAYTDEERAEIDALEASRKEPWMIENIQDEDTLYKTKDYYFSTIFPVGE